MVLRTISEIEEHAERLNNAASRRDQAGIDSALGEIKGWLKGQLIINDYINAALSYVPRDGNATRNYLIAQKIGVGPHSQQLQEDRASSSGIVKGREV
ncbi:MAG: hypothetical protein IPP74_04580 [Alphaproteobacteria bacterium]|nr:hypothetical protein [Alphaproteobacteria bacterium]